MSAEPRYGEGGRGHRDTFPGLSASRQPAAAGPPPVSSPGEPRLSSLVLCLADMAGPIAQMSRHSQAREAVPYVTLSQQEKVRPCLLPAHTAFPSRCPPVPPPPPTTPGEREEAGSSVGEKAATCRLVRTVPAEVSAEALQLCIGAAFRHSRLFSGAQ